ncbi:uncharacterized protein J3D65DRAFT_670993 [Phyllosticta citribraziliensis]|uniref:Only prolin and serin are matching in the corresponding protein n=1 Tax=Phyllosticta citribraziliensis TaxID=989973 RepID=A0ABR1LCL7_9PEZI
MRDMKPLLLPAMVASDDRTPVESGQSTSSECSTPQSSVFSAYGHARHPSSISSISSSPPSSYEHLDNMTSSTKLPRLPEDPMEEPVRSDVEDDDDDDQKLASWCLCSVTDGCPHSENKSTTSLAQTPSYEFDDEESRSLSRRRKSGESPAISSRFPSLTRRWKERTKTMSSPSRENTRSTRSSRASSMTGSVVQASLNTSETELPCSDDNTSCPDDVVKTLDVEPIDRKALASTPLLPPVLVAQRASEETLYQSPLQSPTVADPNASFSAMNSPLGTPQAPFVQTPPLSTRPSVASFRHGRPSVSVPSADIPPMTISDDGDVEDEWSVVLGHANFSISPEPYLPDVCDAPALHELAANWERARCNYTKHQVRTGEHFGVTSKTYKLTEQKWAGIDRQWKRCYDRASDEAGLADAAVSEPPPVMALMSLEDPKKPGQFPQLGDEDIVGPMVQIAARNMQQSPKRKAALVKFFNDIKFPGAFLGRSPAVSTK